MTATSPDAAAPDVVKSLAARLLPVALICIVAFLLRYVYVVSLDHLLCQFGDAYFFLAGGSKLREFVCGAIQAGNFDLLKALPPASPNGMVAMGSIGVSDRLMVDGPIFPSYLALLQWLVGLAPGSILFDSRAVQISLLNALLDSFTCLFIFLGARAAFGQKVAYIAAALFAVYPASIINTQSCYTEPFGCFVLAVWTWLVLKTFAWSQSSSEQLLVSKKTNAWVFVILGVVTGLLTLTRPPFVFLPVIFTTVLTGLRIVLRPKNTSFALKAFWPVMPLLVGLLIVILPWLGVTHKATGRYTLFVNRLPAFNLFLGNQLSRDGWRAYPFSENIPETVAVTAGEIFDQARSAPFAFMSMELRKIPRLWLGTWNEFQYPLFGLPVVVQEVLHQVLLSLAAIGLLLLTTRLHSLRKYDAAVSLVIAVLVVQSLYLAFEPISRYTMTAMPVIMMLAGYALSALSAKNRVHTAGALATVTILVVAMQAQREVLALLESFCGEAAITVFAPGLYVFLLLVGYLTLLKLLARAGLRSRSFTLTLGGAFAVVAILVAVSIEGNPESAEWQATLSSPVQMIRQEIVMPAQTLAAPSGQAYLLLDMAQGQCPALLNICIDGDNFQATPTPWWQLRPNPGFLEALSLSEKAMATSLYSFRQWYVVPVPASLIKYGAVNTVTVAPATGAPLTVYGDYSQPGQTQTKTSLPSLRLASWTKAFCTYDHLDARVYESIATAAVHSAHSFDGGRSWLNWDNRGLVSDFARQTGQYRIHFIVFPRDVQAGQHAFAAVTGDRRDLISLPAVRIISGANPLSMNLGQSVVNPVNFLAPLPVPTQSQDFAFNCQLSSPGDNGWAFVGVQFEGENARGVNKKWTSSWQPCAIKTSRAWMPLYFADALPAEISSLHNLRVSVTGCSFYPDLLLLHKEQAIKSKISAKDVRLTLGARHSESPSDPYQLY